MIVGKGLIASSFEEFKVDKSIIIFASGVSDSTQTDKNEFLREISLLKKVLEENKNRQLIYFSSCSLEDDGLKNTPYHVHKKYMEDFIKKNVDNYLIFRLPNVIGYKGSKESIINFLYNKISTDNSFKLWRYATRNIIDVEDLKNIITYIIKQKYFSNDTINIAYENNIGIIDIVNTIEEILEKKSNYSIVDKGMDLKIDNTKIMPILKELEISQPSIEFLIKKYKLS